MYTWLVKILVNTTRYWYPAARIITKILFLVRTDLRSCSDANKTQIEEEKFCDGIEHCPGGSDEWVSIDGQIHQDLR